MSKSGKRIVAAGAAIASCLIGSALFQLSQPTSQAKDSQPSKNCTIDGKLYSPGAVAEIKGEKKVCVKGQWNPLTTTK